MTRLPHLAIFCIVSIVCLNAPRAPGGVLDASHYAHHLDFRFSGYAGTETLVDFPVLIRLSKALNDFRHDACMIAGGGDLRFSDANGALLPSEVERWDPAGESLVWVKVPTLTRGTVITAHYGCASPDAVTPSDVWDAHYLGVWHLGAAAGASTQPDSTAYNHSFAINANYSDGVACGTNGIAGLAAATGLRADGKGCFSQTDSGKFFTGLSQITVEAWTYQDHHDPADAGSERYILAHGFNTGAYDWRLRESQIEPT